MHEMYYQVCLKSWKILKQESLTTRKQNTWQKTRILGSEASSRKPIGWWGASSNAAAIFTTFYSKLQRIFRHSLVYNFCLKHDFNLLRCSASKACAQGYTVCLYFLHPLPLALSPLLHHWKSYSRSPSVKHPFVFIHPCFSDDHLV